MELVTLTINGKTVSVEKGKTILEAATAAGIEIPTLCHHPELCSVGSCRICLVEIEKQRGLHPSCTYPAGDGMVVQTETPRLAASRKFNLELIFSERQHYCMFCPMSGTDSSTDCELQKLAYRYGLTHWPYPPRYDKHWELDATRRHFVMDHSRCILCRRCIRACDDIAANHTLGLQRRGAKTMVCADDGMPFNQSTCISCGTCLQVCPTGALSESRGSFLGHETEVKRTKATCLGCAVGCGIEAVTRDNQLLRIEGDWEAPNNGLLCSTGRFAVLEEPGERILQPYLRRSGELSAVSWEEAVDVVVTRLKTTTRAAGLISPKMTNRLLAGFAYFFFETLHSNDVALLYGEVPALDLGRPAKLEDVAASDCIVVIGGDPLRSQKVLGYFIKRAWDKGAKVLVVNDSPTELDAYATAKLQLDDIAHSATSPFKRLHMTYHLRIDGMAKVRAAVQNAKSPVILYGPGLSSTLYAALRTLSRNAAFMPLVEGANSLGAHYLGLEVRPVEGEVLYAIIGDDCHPGISLPKSDFTILQAAYLSDLTAGADIVLPARTWCEKPGELINSGERKVPSVPLVDPPKGVRADLETLLMISVRLGHVLPYDQISDMCSVVRGRVQ